MLHKFVTKSGAEIRILRTSTGCYKTSEGIGKYERLRGKRRHRHSCEDEQQLEKEIDKEIQKPKYCLD